MKRFIKFLIFKLQTVDGNRGSGEKIIKAMIKEKMDTVSEVHDFISDRRFKECETEIQIKFMKKVYFKYLILKFRAKVSYHAFVKNETILQFFLGTVM